MGQAFTVAAYVLPPRDSKPSKTVGAKKMKAEGKTGVEETHAKGTHEEPEKVQKHTTLAVNQKAVM